MIPLSDATFALLAAGWPAAAVFCWQLVRRAREAQRLRDQRDRLQELLRARIVKLGGGQAQSMPPPPED